MLLGCCEFLSVNTACISYKPPVTVCFYAALWTRQNFLEWRHNLFRQVEETFCFFAPTVSTVCHCSPVQPTTGTTMFPTNESESCIFLVVLICPLRLPTMPHVVVRPRPTFFHSFCCFSKSCFEISWHCIFKNTGSDEPQGEPTTFRWLLKKCFKAERR